MHVESTLGNTGEVVNKRTQWYRYLRLHVVFRGEGHPINHELELVKTYPKTAYTDFDGTWYAMYMAAHLKLITYLSLHICGFG